MQKAIVYAALVLLGSASVVRAQDALSAICADAKAITVNGSANTARLTDIKAKACAAPAPIPTPTPVPPPTPTPTPTPMPAPPIGSVITVAPGGLAAGLKQLRPGSTLVLQDGIYAEPLTNIPNGTAMAPVTIQAAHDGAAIVTGGLTLVHTNAYITIAGLHFRDTTGRTIVGNHLTFQRDAFEGGCASGNCVNVGIGTNDVNDTADILLEDSWAYGAGGRYNILVYNANRVVLRRVVVRHDGGWTDTKGDPEAGITFYNCSSCAAQNAIVLDSNLTYHTWQSAFYAVQNSASPNSSNGNSWTGIIALNNLSGSDGAGLRFDGDQAQTGHVIQDAVLWGANWGLNVSYAAAIGVTASRLTLGLTKCAGACYAIGGGSGGTKSFTSVRLVNAQLSGVSATSTASTPPTYLPQQVGGIGANVMTMIGATGTRVGDAGWNVDTGVALWPWPNETRLKAEMCAGVTRGFCGDSSLTHYIWNDLGNGSPF